MKKIALLLGIASMVFLAWCGKTWQDMSFEDAYKTLKSHNIFNEKQFSPTDPTLALYDETTIKFNLFWSEWFSATGDLFATGVFNPPDKIWGSEIHIALDVLWFEPWFWGNVSLTSHIQLVEQDSSIYWLIHSFWILTANEKPNIEGGMINAIVNTIAKQRIQLNTPWEKTSLLPYRRNIITFFHQLNRWWNANTIFKASEKTKIDWFVAYKLEWDEEGIKKFVDSIAGDAKKTWTPITLDGKTLDEAINSLVASPLEWYLIIRWEDHIILQINSIKTKDIWEVSISYDKYWLSISAKNSENISTVSGNFQKTGSELVFSFEIPKEELLIYGKSKDKQSNLEVEIKNPWYTINAIIFGKTYSGTPIPITQVTWSRSIQQIQQWFTMLSEGLTEETTTP